ncbi:MAG TPA: RNA-binding protein [Candidatus Saccharimonadales bacterium]|nr:RNA-binding protein [Candidatus Saccharimonadales bacterium]
MAEENSAQAQNKLFVGGIAWAATDESLKSAFAAFGTVESAEVVRDRMSGRSKGFGFVVMSTPEEAQAAVDKMNGQMLDGRPVTVNIARPKTEKPQE